MPENDTYNSKKKYEIIKEKIGRLELDEKQEERAKKFCVNIRNMIVKRRRIRK